ncbi:hypothetical protein PG997_005373 [Apiospora hydei]|uniref:Citrate transporter-like domain-containing protein n=1 Tax=Apiospora hydei TaxID=1337664 RepID=A0ABR1X4U9_9PEZI
MENLSTDTSQIREWQSIITIIAFFLASNGRLLPPHPRTHQHDHRPLIADLFLLATLSIGRPEVRNGILGANGIDPIDVMVFFITLAYIALSLDASGMIRYLACRVLRASKSGRRLYFYLYGFFFALTTCIGNDPIILSGTPFLAYITRVSNIEHPGAAWIYSQFAIANIASAILVSSNPTNLVLTAAFGIRFIDYTANIIVPVLFTVVLLFPFLLFVVFRDRRFIPRTIEMQKLEHHEGGLREVLNPYLDKKSAIFAALVMAATLVTRRREREQEELRNEKSEQLPRRRQAPVVSPSSTEVEPSSDNDEIRPAPTPLVPQPSSDDDEKSSADTDLERQISHQLQLRHSRPQPPEPTTLASLLRDAQAWSRATFPTATTVLSLLPFPLVPFAFAMFVLVEALVTKGWVPVFAYGWHHWVNKTGTVGAIGGMGFVSVFSGTNIGTTILLCRILQTWRQLHLDVGTPISDRTFWGAVYSMAVGVNYGAFSSAFSASLAGLLWRDILAKKGVWLRRTEFLRANVPIISVAMAVGLAVLVGEIYLVRGEQPYVLREGVSE